MNIYTFSNSSAKKLATKQILSIIPILIAMSISVFLIVNKLENNEFIKNRDFQLIFLGVLLFIFTGGFIKGTKTVTQILIQTKFIIDDGTIEKSIPNGDNIKISFREVRNYSNTKKGILLKTAKKQLLIPRLLTNFDELESILKNNIQTGITNYNTQFKVNEVIIKNVTAISIMTLLVSFFVINGKQNKLLMGIPLLLILVYSIINTIKNKHIAGEISAMVPKLILYSILLLGYLIYILFLG